MLLFGSFNYGKRGILDRTHKRLFTFKSLKNLLNQHGFSKCKFSGIPAPFPLAIGDNFLSKFLIKINQFLIKISKTIFSYQIYCQTEPDTSLELLLEQAKFHAESKK